jgi:SAM-dependent methyltransferase
VNARAAVGRLGDAAAWHDVECASYAADLPLWRELADAARGAVLELGCGTGRVALDLARRGHEVVGLDADPALVRVLASRARERGLAVEAVVGDARSFALGRRFPLVVAPMQVVQLLGGAEGRRAMLRSARRHLEPGGLLAVALADPFDAVPAADALPPLPDVREEGGWVLSSTPVAVRPVEGAVEIDRLRQAIAPGGEISETLVTIALESVDPATLESEARAEGLSAQALRRVPPTRDHVGSAIVLLEPS